jgi:hypothetical protein
LVTKGVSVEGVVVGARVLRTNKSGVFVGSREKGVTVGAGDPACAGPGVCRNGSAGKPVHPARRETVTRIRTSFFIRPLR